MHPNFKSSYPRSTALGLTPVSTAGGVEHDGFDIDQVEKILGPRFAAFMASITPDDLDHAQRLAAAGELKSLFSCGHRKWPHDHPEETKRNCEVHCAYARDVEEFLLVEEFIRKAGG
jgi:hypothetical protein